MHEKKVSRAIVHREIFFKGEREREREEDREKEKKREKENDWERVCQSMDERERGRRIAIARCSKEKTNQKFNKLMILSGVDALIKGKK